MSAETKTNDGGAVKSEDTIQYIPIDKLQELKDHAFKPYKGKRLEQLTQSIRENGVTQPIIVRLTKNSIMYEIVSGHNRVEAAKQAGLKEVAAVVRKLSDDEATILANETNVTQRSFKDWLPSEKAKSIYQYHETIKKQGKRPSKKADTSGGNSQKSDDDARTKTAKVYGVKGNIIRQYLEIYRLTDELMDKLDNGYFGITTAQTISFISPSGQGLVNAVLDGDKDSCIVTVENSQKLRSLLENYDGKDADEEIRLKTEVRRLLEFSSSESDSSADDIKNLPLAADLYEELFSDRPLKVAIEVLIEAVRLYHKINSDKTDKVDENPDQKDTSHSATADDSKSK